MAVDRIVAAIKADPNRERLDRVITRWLKRHLQWVGAEVDLEHLNSLLEDQEMLAENMRSWVQKERDAARRRGWNEGRQEGCQETRLEVVKNLIALGVLTDEQIAAATGMDQAAVKALRTIPPTH